LIFYLLFKSIAYTLLKHWLEFARSVIAVCTLLAFSQLPDVAVTAVSKLGLAQLIPIKFYAPSYCNPAKKCANLRPTLTTERIK